MTNKEAEKIINILCTADGGCFYCSEDLIERFIREFPKHEKLSLRIFREKFKRYFND